jgi:uncharacterized protein YciI
MALYHVTLTDRPDALKLRLATRPSHLAYLGALGAAIKLGGPFLAPDGESPIGTILLIEAPDRAALDAIVAGDPYVKAGLFSAIEVRHFRQVAPPPGSA